MEKKERIIRVPISLNENNILIYTTINGKEYSALFKYDPDTITQEKLFDMYKKFAASTMITIDNSRKGATKT